MNFDKKKILLLGYGREGRSTHRFLKKHFPGVRIGIADAQEQKEYEFPPEEDCSYGDAYLEGLQHFDLIFRSPGIALSDSFYEMHRERLTSQTEVFLSSFREQTIGVTGTKGKSSTVSLLTHVLKTLGHPCHALGNIGVPALDLYDQIQPGELVVFELSSHQLHHVSVSPHIAVLLNIYPEHLDYYSDFDAYARAKMNIIRHQRPNDFAVTTQEVLDRYLESCTLPSQCVLVEDDSYFNFDEYRQKAKSPFLPELNVRAFLAVLRIIDVDVDLAWEAAIQFAGMPHRIERIDNVSDNIVCYNDSAASIPQATVFALQQLPDTAVLIVGGLDRGVDYRPLIAELSGKRDMTIIFLPPSGARIRELLQEQISPEERNIQLYNAADLAEAVSIARENLTTGEICLFSPASASYHAYANYNERGEAFRKLVSVKN